MKILYIIPNLNKGGAERMALDICNHLSKREGVTVKMVILQNSIMYDTSSYSFEIKYIDASVSLSVTKSNTYKVEALQAFVDAYQPDVINTALFTAEIVSRTIDYPRAKWFTHCQDNMFQFRNFALDTLVDKKRLACFYEKQYLIKRYKANGGNTFITISKHTDDYFREVLPSGEFKQVILPNAADFDRFENKNIATKQRTGPLKLITIGSFVDKKNQKFLIDVMKVFADRQIAAELHILGDGPNRDMLKQKTADLGLAKQVIFHGNVQLVENLLWESDIYVHAATYEPFGIVFIEAMAAGLPVVTLDGWGNRDIIKNDENGYLFYDIDAIRFADKVLDIYSNKEKYDQMSRGAIAFAKTYDIKENVTQLLKIYRA